jgi:hypothetical protein
MSTEKILITPYYKTNDSRRNVEIDTVLSKNINSGVFEKIVLFCDPGCIPPFDSKNIEIEKAVNRPTYLDFFMKGNQYPNKIIVISNSDIFFDKSLFLSRKYIMERREVLALTRYEYYKKEDSEEYVHEMIMGCDSQDSWIYLSPINMQGMEINFGLGVPGCDNRVAYELSKNYLVRNPSFSIKTYHIHDSNVRNYDPNNRLEGRYLQLHME